MKAKTKSIQKAAAQVIIINSQLTDAEIALLQHQGIFPDMSVEDVQADDIEGGMWIRIRNERPSDLIELKELIQDYSGWTDRDASDFARSIWKAAQKLIKSSLK